MDRTYIAPHLSAREKIKAGLFLLFDAGFFLLGIGLPALVLNFFSPNLPRRWKLGNALVLLLLLGLIAAIPLSIMRCSRVTPGITWR